MNLVRLTPHGVGIRRGDETPDRAGETEHRALSRGLHVPAEQIRVAESFPVLRGSGLVLIEISSGDVRSRIGRSTTRVPYTAAVSLSLPAGQSALLNGYASAVGEGSQIKVAANDFSRQWEDVRQDALAAIDRVGRSGWLILGEEVEAFEREFAAWWGIPYAVGVGSGLDALEIALRCGGLPPGSRVLTTPLTAFATTLAILRADAEPVWCDVDETGCLDLEQADAALRADRSIRAVMPVHLYGNPVDLARLEALAAEHDVVLVEDCAQSAGAEHDGRPTGTAGVVAATSLYPTKNLGAMGDGGVLLTADAGLAERARSLRDYGQRARYEHTNTGLNSRLDELHAAVLRSALLPRLDTALGRRREIASRYSKALSGGALRPIAPGSGTSAHHLFAIEVTKGDPAGIAAKLRNRGIAVARHYPFLCPEQPAVKGVGTTVGSLAVARRLADRELSLPIHPYLGDDEASAVIEACREVTA